MSKGIQLMMVTSTLPSKFNAKQLEQNYGYKTEAEYKTGYQDGQVGKADSVVAPFTLLNAANIELNTSGDILREMLDKAGLGEWKDYLESNDLSAEQFEQLKTQVRQEFESQFETIAEINNTVTKIENALAPEAYLEARDQLEDALESMAGDTIRENIANAELPEWVSPDGICEIQ